MSPYSNAFTISRLQWATPQYTSKTFGSVELSVARNSLESEWPSLILAGEENWIVHLPKLFDNWDTKLTHFPEFMQTERYMVCRWKCLLHWLCIRSLISNYTESCPSSPREYIALPSVSLFFFVCFLLIFLWSCSKGTLRVCFLSITLIFEKQIEEWQQIISHTEFPLLAWVWIHTIQKLPTWLDGFTDICMISR